MCGWIYFMKQWRKLLKQDRESDFSIFMDNSQTFVYCISIFLHSRTVEIKNELCLIYICVT